MNIEILGSGAFGSFLSRELPAVGFNVVSEADTIIFAIPAQAYYEAASDWIHSGKQIINVCSIQLRTTENLLNVTKKVTSIHPLFGPRTPADKRNSLLTYQSETKDEKQFLELFGKFSRINSLYNPENHDRLMAKTHLAAVRAAKAAKVFVEDAADVPDEFIPNSFRLLREFVKTLDDMPQGTIDSITSNPFQ